MKFRIIEKEIHRGEKIEVPENSNKTSPLVIFPQQKNKVKPNSPVANTKFWRKILLYFLFEINSAFTTEVSKKVFEARKEKCLGCPGLAKSPQDPIGYCKLCGCGMNPRARLTVKLTVAGATCPKKLWKPVRGKFSVKNFTKSLLGISQTVWYNLKQLCKSKKHN